MIHHLIRRNNVVVPIIAFVALLLTHQQQLVDSFSTQTTTTTITKYIGKRSLSHRGSSPTTPLHGTNATPHHERSTSLSTILPLRGGAANTAVASSILATLSTTLPSGPLGIPSLVAVASLPLVPLTIYRQGYSFSVGYGTSVATMALALLLVIPTPPPTGISLAVATVVYGLRLAGHLLLREGTVPEKAAQIKAFDKSKRLSRVPFAVSVAVFYAFMTSPVLYAMRAVPAWEGVAVGGGVLAWVGLALEAVADAHKLWVKRGGGGGGSGTFSGPVSGVYGLVRHPNYLGEILFWLGLLVGGMPSFGLKSPVPWICGVCGFYGIYTIMTSATKRLEEKQSERYKGQTKYDEWVKAVPFPLFPLIR